MKKYKFEYVELTDFEDTFQKEGVENYFLRDDWNEIINQITVFATTRAEAYQKVIARLSGNINIYLNEGKLNSLPGKDDENKFEAIQGVDSWTENKDYKTYLLRSLKNPDFFKIFIFTLVKNIKVNIVDYGNSKL